MPSEVDLVITFRTSTKTTRSKQQTREDAQRAERQYSRLIDTLSSAGLRAVGRRGESLGHLLVFVLCPTSLINNLVKRERHSDFLHGLPTTPIAAEGDTRLLSPANRIRLIHDHITSSSADGGLGIIPGSSDWDLVESVLALHDRKFNETWVRSWTLRKIFSVEGTKIREQFGDSVALYFSFLSSYTKALIIPAILGIAFYLFGTPYSPTYSILLLLWSIIFVEWWRVRERILSLRFGSRDFFRVEKRRPQYTPGFAWWHRELRMVASIPVILMFAGVLAALLTAIFVFEAFVTQLYAGPGRKYIAFSPTILFAALVPRFLALYQSSAQRFTAWENHAHHSTHAASLTLKTFALSALVAYLGLALSAFVYVPFGEGVMHMVQVWFSGGDTPSGPALNDNLNATLTDAAQKANVTGGGMWDVDASSAGRKLNPGRLRDQMFAYTVTNQAVNTFIEIGLPFILRGLGSLRNRKKKQNGSSPMSPGTKKKRVVFEDEQEKGGKEEREFLERVRSEAALPEYELFGDYSEMVTQFGYVALWSTIWPLASVMALLNNILELRSDAFKITVHNRRPIPCRTDTIGPWLDALSFLTWLAALTNSALVYLFCPRSQNHCNNTGSMSPLDKVHQRLFSTSGAGNTGDAGATRELLTTALLIALVASHGYMVLRVVVRHVVERVVWKANDEVKEREREEKEIKEKFLKELVGEDSVKLREGDGRKVGRNVMVGQGDDGGDTTFWNHDEGLEEIQRISKEA